MKRKIVIGCFIIVALLCYLYFSSGYDDIKLIGSYNPNIVTCKNYKAELLLADLNYKEKKDLGEFSFCYTDDNIISLAGPNIYKDGFNVPIYEYINVYNKDGEYMCGIKNSIMSYFHRKYLVLFNGKKSIAINYHSGKIISKIDYNIKDVLTDNQKKYYFIVKDNDKYGIVDEDNNIKLPIKYDSISTFINYIQTEKDSNYTLCISKDNKYGVCKQDGKIVIPLQYDSIESESTVNKDNSSIYLLLRLKKGNTEIVVDSNGKQISLYNEYDDITQHGNNYYSVNKDGKSGLVTLNNETIIPFEYDFTGTKYKNKLIIGSKNINDKEALDVYDTNGNVISSLSYDAFNFRDDKVVVIYENKKYGAINLKNKKEIIPIEYDFVCVGTRVDLHLANFLTLRNGKPELGNATYGVATKEGKIILKPEYDSINYFELNDLISARKNNKGYLFDKNGKVLIDGIRDNILKVFINNGRYYAIISNSLHKQNYKDITKEVLG